MYLQRPDEKSGGSRFLLALSLSTVTAFAVAAPLAFKAVAVDSDIGGQDADVSGVTESSTTTTAPPSGPQIGPKVRSPQAKLPIGPGLPSDYPLESTTEQATTAPIRTATTVAATVGSTTAVAAPSTSTTETTARSTTSAPQTSTIPTSTSAPSTSTTIDPGSSSSQP